ncbi:RNA ligase [Mycena albidolilacea]|uniref:RNA ligase n=1 Tax=Mycena albidolilacea TaxID=1033008 RepID=A0AAD7EZX9_9AGAR|nr:RNA ligase [Mycena albidolilacea]
MAHPSATKDSALIDQLMTLAREKPKLVRASTYAAPADPALSISSWKMAEHKYYVVPSPFPTLARGVFSIKQPDGRYRVVARGYDKFFNIGEVPWTTWPALEVHTAGPYTLSLKSNGCIIFIAALTPDKLLVTSKHSLGPAKAGEGKLSHADAGEVWLRRYLAQNGRTEADLARVLWEKNWTAVAELCDDSFEEHVLPYPPELTGLHLHGLNTSTLSSFTTQPHSVVDAFAAEWGFIKTKSVELGSIKEVREFAAEAGKKGEWEGEPVEGFVVRGRVGGVLAEGGEEGRAEGKAPRNAPPYPPGASFFFKIKFDEPYMMYRDWREVTKMLLSMRKKDASTPTPPPKNKGKGANDKKATKAGGKGNAPDDGMSVDLLPKSKLRRPETVAYARWVIEEIRRDPAAFSAYGENRGIVAVRERFLTSGEGRAVGAEVVKEQGKEEAEVEQSEEGKEKFTKTIIVPVAIPGCGKTAVSVALADIFGFGHTQSDDVNAKKPAPVFIKNVIELLETHDVVIADKNNHLRQHRQALRTAASAAYPDPRSRVRLLALNWALDAHTPAAVHRLCAARITRRGENHQTLRPRADAPRAHEDVLWQFITKGEPLARGEVDEVVEMEVFVDGEEEYGPEKDKEGLERAVRRAVDACVKVLGVLVPEEGRVQAAVEKARGYTPGTITPRPERKVKEKEPRYYGFVPDVDDLVKLLEPYLVNVPFWGKLFSDGRVWTQHHATLVHKRSLQLQAKEDTPKQKPKQKQKQPKGDSVDSAAVAEAQALWARCKALRDMGAGPLFRIRLGHIVWNGRVMAVTVDDIELAEEAAGTVAGRAAAEFVTQLSEQARRQLHITMGTRGTDVPPVEAKAMVELWRKSPSSAESKAIENPEIVTKAKVLGLWT